MNTLRALVDLRNRTIQKTRIALGSMIDSVERGDDELPREYLDLIQGYYEDFQELEERVDGDVAELIEEYEIFPYLDSIIGVSHSLAAQLVSMLDPHEAPYPSSFWKFAGYALDWYWRDEDGRIRAPKRGRVWDDDEGKPIWIEPEPMPSWDLVKIPDRQVKGYLSPYNKRLKAICNKVGMSIRKAPTSPYNREHDEKLAHYEETHPEWTLGHKKSAARRAMVKLFLVHLHVRWRELEGLETTKPWVVEHGGHGHYKAPEDYGWPQIGALDD